MPATTQKQDTPRRKNRPATRPPAKPRAAKASAKAPPVLLHTDEEIDAYLAAHLTPVRYGPKGQPIYAYEDHAKLNIIIRPGV